MGTEYTWVEGPPTRTLSGQDRTYAVSPPCAEDTSLDLYVGLQRRPMGKDTETMEILTAPQLVFILRQFVKIHGPDVILNELKDGF